MCMTDKIVVVMDCGATNVRAVAINTKGEILAIKSMPNNTQKDPNNPQMVIWDAREIWEKLSACCREVVSKIDSSQIAAITVTTFGVDGAPFKKDGTMLYPVISWQCERTNPIMENIDRYIPLQQLYLNNGVQPAAINTINKLIWLKENEPNVLEEMDAWLFISSIFLYYLSGEMVTDNTMAGTSMLTDVTTQQFSGKILDSIGLSSGQFPRMVSAGEVVGQITSEASSQTGIPAGVPVVAAGHDTQFAIFGSGADKNVPVLSSGTWEILMVRTNKASIDKNTLEAGITTEFDAIPGCYNMGVNAIASGVIEWVKNHFFAKETAMSGDVVWETMIEEAAAEPVGSNGVFLHPTFFPGAIDNTRGTLFGLTLQTKRSSVFRATLEALSCLQRKNLEMLQEAGGFQAERMIVVGGGSKNRLWNQIRADVSGIPVELIAQKETTVLGAALFAFAGAGVFKSPSHARENIDYTPQIIEPNEKNHHLYEKIYSRFTTLTEKLSQVY